MWADRVRSSAMADAGPRAAASTPEELQRLSDGWRAWAAAPDGWLSILHGEILARP